MVHREKGLLRGELDPASSEIAICITKNDRREAATSASYKRNCNLIALLKTAVPFSSLSWARARKDDRSGTHCIIGDPLKYRT